MEVEGICNGLKRSKFKDYITKTYSTYRRVHTFNVVKNYLEVCTKNQFCWDLPYGSSGEQAIF